MATLDISILEFLTPIFTFLFIMVVLYAILDKFKFLGDKTAPKLLVSFSVAMLFIFSKEALKAVNIFTPWFLVLALVGFLIIAILMFWGVKEESVSRAITKEVVWPVVIVGILFFVIVVVIVFQDAQSPYEDTDEKTRTSEGFNAIFHPRVLGAVLLLVIALFAITNISRGITPIK